MTLISDKEKTEVWQGAQDVESKSLQVLYKVQKTFDLCIDVSGPSVILANKMVAEAYARLPDRGVKVRFITEITRTNVTHCREILKIAELRHLDGIKGSFVIADGMDYAGVANTEEAQPITQLIVSNVRAFVKQQKYFFETLWGKSIPANLRMREIEEGVARPETRVLGRPEEILAEITYMNDRSNEMYICATSGGLQFTRNFLFDLTKKLLDRQRKGKHHGVKYVTNINSEDLTLVREFLDLGMQIRHAKYMPPMSFAVSEKEMGATIEKMEGNRMVQSLLMSNEQLYVQHFKSMFDELWKGGIDAAERIKEIEQGVQAADIEIMHNPKQALERAWNMIMSSQREVLLMFSTTGAFQRQLQMGGLEIIKAAIKSGTKVKVLLPADDQIKGAIALARAQLPQVEIRMMDKSLHAKITIVVVDRKECMLFELKDDTKQSSYEAVGLSMHSGSKTIVLSYASIFDSLWKQTELYEQLASANEQLDEHDRMQREFINVAAHELRTPVQPLLGITELVSERMEAGKADQVQVSKEEVDMLARNARRLEKLTQNILDVTKIEGKKFTLNKEKFDLNTKIQNTINDMKAGLDEKTKNIVINFTLGAPIYVEADKTRIYEVISNLISNAIKFTQKGTINIALVREENFAKVVVKDSGKGLDPEVMPKLFTRFASKSESGTGLGLYISKSIIEAHGGRIWAENNKDGRGATLSFHIPVLQ
ncbi:MAG TPA: HAMP domain-containing sensor histidine kinase [Nitrososphaera sp.]|nr:HAMP domain-containing sensor histidine kinase [Nitrososphaera sp.]